MTGTDRNNSVIVAPDQQRRCADAAQQMRQGLAVHVGFPGGPERHLARDVPRLQLVRGHIAIDAGERGLVMETRLRIVEYETIAWSAMSPSGGLIPIAPTRTNRW